MANQEIVITMDTEQLRQLCNKLLSVAGTVLLADESRFVDVIADEEGFSIRIEVIPPVKSDEEFV